MKFSTPTFWLALVILAIMVLANPMLLMAQSVNDLTWKDRFLNEAPKGWARYHTYSSRLQGSGTTKAFSLEPKKKLVGEIGVIYKQGPGCGLVLFEGIPTRNNLKEDRLSAANPQYRFTLSKAKSTSPWAISDISPELVKESIMPDLDPISAVRAAVAAPIAINFNPKDDWPTIVSSPDFRLKSVVAVEEKGNTIVQVDFEMNWSPSKENLIRVKTGRVWFDPKHCWVMRKCDYKLERLSGKKPPPPLLARLDTYDYNFDIAEFPILKTLVRKYFNSKGEIEVEEYQTFNLVVEDVPESAFTLSAFGFPEPFGVTTKPTPWYLWVAGAGITCLVLGVFVNWFKRRSAKTLVEGG